MAIKKKTATLKKDHIGYKLIKLTGTATIPRVVNHGRFPDAVKLGFSNDKKLEVGDYVHTSAQLQYLINNCRDIDVTVRG